MYHSLLIHSSADGHLGYFHVLAIINSAVMNIAVHMSLSDLISSVCMPRSGSGHSIIFFWTGFKLFTLSLFFSMMSLSMAFFLFIHSWYLYVNGTLIFFHQVWETIWYCSFKYFFCLTFSFFIP